MYPVVVVGYLLTSFHPSSQYAYERYEGAAKTIQTTLTLDKKGGYPEDNHVYDLGQGRFSAVPRRPQKHRYLRPRSEEASLSLSDVCALLM